jgi:predicted DNA-binding transcriptional regulator AlpA
VLNEKNVQSVRCVNVNLYHYLCMDLNVSQDLLQESDVAQLLTVSVAALCRWRVEARGPRYVKIGSLVRYRRSDVELWITTRPSGGETGSSKRSPRLRKPAVIAGGHGTVRS